MSSRVKPWVEVLTELIENPPPLDVIWLHLSVADEGAGTHLGFYQARELEFGIGAADRVRVDGQINRELPHGRQTVAGRQAFGGNGSLHLVDDLAVEGNTALEIEFDFDGHSLLQCSSLLMS